MNGKPAADGLWFSDLTRLVEPRSIVLVGASEKPDSIGAHAGEPDGLLAVQGRPPPGQSQSPTKSTGVPATPRCAT
ncbi:hypothetical protein ACU4GD_20365 [Cupriavidus basilensis]